MATLTVFTPTYNRAYMLPQLYESLLRQTCHDFEWLIVDDGSTDDTESMVQKWAADGEISIRYFRQTNGGKHAAINRGVAEARGELFFIVDSDDYLSEDAVEWLWKAYAGIRGDARFAGVSGTRIRPDGSRIGGAFPRPVIDSDAINIRLTHGVKGDLAEAFKTDVLRQYPFPVFEKEPYCTEALVWHRIARRYRMRYCDKGIYVCSYLGDGLTAKITRIRRRSPRGSMLYYSEHFHDKIKLQWRLKAAINFWRFQLMPYNREYRMLTPLSLMAYLPGKLFSLIDSRI